MKDLLLENFKEVFEIKLIEAIEEVAFIKDVKEGEHIIKIGNVIKYMPLILKGAIKISRHDDNGDELLLYYLEKGDVCAMTLNCCLGNKLSDVEATAELDTSIIMVPVQKMADWMRQFDSWRTFVFNSYNSRFEEMLETIDNLAFLNMSQRILKFLNEKVNVNKSALLAITHQTIAYDLHTSRVVVSRILKSLEVEGKLKLHRNKIEMLQN